MLSFLVVLFPGQIMWYGLLQVKFQVTTIDTADLAP